ncbi:hypothetical protein [Pseudomonas sivasensis]|uniref:HTH marR-type domain-containing protein n=1 Tax=Pseudomonas sivasensis TaxID=1880678 RepID=A0ABW8DYY8_9PSED
MDMKGSLGKVIGWPLAIAALVGQSFIGYVTENGQVPPWMPERLGGLAGWLSTDVSIPVWSLVLILVCVGAVGTLFVKYQSRTKPRGARLNADAVAATHQRCVELEEVSIRLKESTISLQQQLQQKTQALEALQAKKLAVSDIGMKVLTVIARCTDRDARPTLSTIALAMAVGHVEAHAAIDVLIEQKLLEKIIATRGMYFRFTPKGRAYYMEHKDQ